MKKIKTILCISLLAAGSTTLGCAMLKKPANSGSGGSGSGGSDSGDSDSGGAEAAPAPEANLELRSAISCIDDLVPGDVQRGVMGDYDIKEGMKTSQRSGLLQREPVEPSNTCFLGELQPRECFAITVNEEKYKSLGNSNDWEVQCVYSDDAAAGALENKSEYPYNVDDMPGKAMMLMCGNPAGDEHECAEGSNSARSGLWKEKMVAEGKVQLGFCAGEYLYQELTYDHKAYPGGRWVHCEYYNNTSKKSMFGYDFLQRVRK